MFRRSMPEYKPLRLVKKNPLRLILFIGVFQQSTVHSTAIVCICKILITIDECWFWWENPMNNINRKDFHINHFKLEDIRGSYRCVDLTKRSKPYEKGPLLKSCSFCDHCVNIYQQVFAGAVSELYNKYYNKVLLESRSLYAVSIYVVSRSWCSPPTEQNMPVTTPVYYNIHG